VGREKEEERSEASQEYQPTTSSRHGTPNKEKPNQNHTPAHDTSTAIG